MCERRAWCGPTFGPVFQLILLSLHVWKFHMPKCCWSARQKHPEVAFSFPFCGSLRLVPLLSPRMLLTLCWQAQYWAGFPGHATPISSSLLPAPLLRSHCRAHAAVSDHLIQHELWKEPPSMSLCTSRPGCRYTTHPQRPPPPPPSQPCSALTWGEKIYADSENAW